MEEFSNCETFIGRTDAYRDDDVLCITLSYMRTDVFNRYSSVRIGLTADKQLYFRERLNYIESLSQNIEQSKEEQTQILHQHDIYHHYENL